MEETTKRAVMQRHLRRTDGYTLLETLIALGFFTIVISVVTTVWFIYIMERPVSVKWMEQQLFFEKIQTDIHESRQIDVIDDVLYLTKPDGDIITFEMYQQDVRRQVNNKGHEIILTNIDAITFKKAQRGVRILLTDEQKIFERLLLSYTDG